MRAGAMANDSELAEIEGIAAAVPGRAEGMVDAAEAAAFVQPHRRVHAGEGLEVAISESELARGVEAALHQRGAGAEAAQAGQEVHLAQFAGPGIAALQRRDAAAAFDRAVAFDHEIGAARLRVGAMHPVDFRVVDRETAAAGAELGHHVADDRGDRGVVARFDRADREHRRHLSVRPRDAARPTPAGGRIRPA